MCMFDVWMVHWLKIFWLVIRWFARATRSFGLGELEARKVKYPNNRTEALIGDIQNFTFLFSDIVLFFPSIQWIFTFWVYQILTLFGFHSNFYFIKFIYFGFHFLPFGDCRTQDPPLAAQKQEFVNSFSASYTTHC